MMRRLAGGYLAGVLAGLVVAAAPSQASADGRAIVDGNDVAGPLDIRRATQGHAGPRAVTHSVTTFRRFRSSFLRGENGFTFQFDTNGRPARFERLVFVLWTNGRLRALVSNRRRIIGAARVSRPNARTVRVKVRENLLNPAGYHWLVASFFSGGFDLAPNQRLAFHDMTPPAITLVSFPNPSTNASATLTFPVSFQLADASGIKSWALQRRLVGEAVWETVAEGRGVGTKTPEVAGEEGANYVFRVRATDRAGNRRTSPTRRVSVPLDDTHEELTGAFVGDSWHVEPIPGFLGALQVTGAPEDTFEYQFMGSYVAWIASQMDGVASVTVDETPAVLVDLRDVGAERVKVFERGGLDPSVPHTITIAVHQNGFNVDGFVFR
jgi:hypothetical protein